LQGFLKFFEKFYNQLIFNSLIFKVTKKVFQNVNPVLNKVAQNKHFAIRWQGVECPWFQVLLTGEKDKPRGLNSPMLAHPGPFSPCG
jgi:hypothetical protein